MTSRSNHHIYDLLFHFDFWSIHLLGHFSYRGQNAFMLPKNDMLLPNIIDLYLPFLTYQLSSNSWVLLFKKFYFNSLIERVNLLNHFQQWQSLITFWCFKPLHVYVSFFIKIAVGNMCLKLLHLLVRIKYTLAIIFLFTWIIRTNLPL